ncbi:MAG: hypothetical protein ACRD07_04340 [Acidimicrobiales bacterium]
MDSRPRYLVERAMRPPNPDLCVVPGSTPVVAFGDTITSSVATLGINPSKHEFIDGSGHLLAGPDRRLATLASLGVDRYDDLSDDHGEAIVEDCVSYFERRPYRRWFDPLDRILRGALSASYYERTACHLDLVQWATDPVWTGLPPAVRHGLLRQDMAFLRRQLDQSNLRLVIVNGRAVMDQVEGLGLVRWRQVDTLRNPDAKVCAGESAGTQLIGWTCNLQGTPGAYRHTERLIELVSRHAATAAPVIDAGAPRGPAAPSTDDRRTAPQPSAGDGLVPRGLRFTGKRELIAYLEAWLDRSASDTVGDTTRFKGTAWIFVESPVGQIRINADTTRDGVEALVAMRSPRSYDWLVVANDRTRRCNKVLFSEERTPGWYAYLASPLDHEGPIGDGRG